VNITTTIQLHEGDTVGNAQDYAEMIMNAVGGDRLNDWVGVTVLPPKAPQDTGEVGRNRDQ